MFRVFLLCSGLASGVNILVGYLLYGVAGLNSPGLYAGSVSIAFLSGMGVSFVLNRRFTYAPSERLVRSELRDFLLVSLGGLSLTTGVSYLLITSGRSIMHFVSAGILPAETIAHMVAVGMVAIYSFFAHKYVSFRHQDAAWALGAGQGRAAVVSAKQ